MTEVNQDNLIKRKMIIAKAGSINNFLNLGMASIKDLEVWDISPSMREDINKVVDSQTEALNLWRAFRTKHRI